MDWGDHNETYFLKVLYCLSTPSWLKVGGWAGAVRYMVGEQSGILWPPRIYCHLLGLGVLSISQAQAQAQWSVAVQVPVAWQFYGAMAPQTKVIFFSIHFKSAQNIWLFPEEYCPMPTVCEGAEGAGAHRVDDHDVPEQRRYREERGAAV